MITKQELKTFIEIYSNAKVAVDIPTGELWRSITADRLIKARTELYKALDMIYSDIESKYAENIGNREDERSFI